MLSDVKITVAIFGMISAAVGCLCVYYSFNVDYYQDQRAASVSKPVQIPADGQFSANATSTLNLKPSAYLYQIGAFLLVIEGGFLLGAAAVLIRGTSTTLADDENACQASGQSIAINERFF